MKVSLFLPPFSTEILNQLTPQKNVSRVIPYISSDDETRLDMLRRDDIQFNIRRVKEPGLSILEF